MKLTFKTVTVAIVLILGLVATATWAVARNSIDIRSEAYELGYSNGSDNFVSPHDEAKGNVYAVAPEWLWDDYTGQSIEYMVEESESGSGCGSPFESGGWKDFWTGYHEAQMDLANGDIQPTKQNADAYPHCYFD